jgi:hypothetical protein
MGLGPFCKPLLPDDLFNTLIIVEKNTNAIGTAMEQWG